MTKVAFLGLGVMGGPMAGHLAAKGHQTAVFNRTAAKAEAWAKTHRGRVGESVADAVRDADIVFACLGDDPDVREIAREAFPEMQSGAIFVDHTTTSAALARELAGEAAKHDLHFIDAPVSGGQAGAEKGQLTVMCGGEPAAYARAEPVMAAYAKMTKLLGPVGSGQLTKMVNQICIAGIVEGLSEGLHFAKRAGLDPLAVVDVISKGAAQSWQMENRTATMVQDKFDFGFAVEWMRKDLRIALSEARANGSQLPVTALVDQFYAEVERMGGKRWDTSSLIARLKGS
ncbi:MAG: NAD-binding protein [Alphaproteobacteria bacterium]|nr:NAD-binding protein [Alphaproteobacteria bacterium]